MVVFGSKSSSAKTKLFEQPLDKLFSPKAIKQLNEAISAASPRLPLSSSLSAPLTSTSLTWAKLSQDNSATKRRRTLARLRRFTIDANNNANLIASISSPPPPSSSNQLHHSISTAAITGPTLATNYLTAIPTTSAQAATSNGVQTSSTNTHQLPATSQRATLPTSSSNATTATENGSEHPDYQQEWLQEKSCASNNPACATNQIDEDERARLLLNVLPEPIKCLLNELYLRGPETVGIFRKSPNAKHCRELKQKLESTSAFDGQQQSSIEQFQVTVIASVFKEWLRSLPDCLLMSRLYLQWIDVAKLIEPLHMEKQRQQQQEQGQQIGDSVESPKSQDATAADYNSTNAVPNNHFFKQVNAGINMTSSTMAALGQTHTSRNQAGQLQSNRELSRALSCSTMTTTSDSGNSSTSPSSSSCSPPPPQSDNNVNLPGEARYSRHCEFISSGNRQRSGSEVLDNELNEGQQELNHRSLDNRKRPQMTQLELRERHIECIRIVRQLLELLDEANLILLRAIMCVLWHIANNSEHNKMSSQNLGVCIGQSLLNDEHQVKKGQSSTSNLYTMRSTSNLSSSTAMNGSGHSAASALKQFSTSTFAKRHRRARSQCLLASTLSLTNLSHLSSSPSNGNTSLHNTSMTSQCYLDSSSAQEAAKYVPILVAFMIDNAKPLFGSDIVNLFGKPASKQHEKQQAILKQEKQKQEGEDAEEQNTSNKSPENEGSLASPRETLVSNANTTIEDATTFESSQRLNNQSAAAAAAATATLVAKSNEEELQPKRTTATERLCFKSSDLVIRSNVVDSINTSTSQAHSPLFKQHRRNLSTSVIVKIGDADKTPSNPSQSFDTANLKNKLSAIVDDEKQRVASSSSSSSPLLSEAGTTTSILIVNAPKSATRQLAPTETANRQLCNQSTSSYSSDSAGRVSGNSNSSSSCGSTSDDEVNSCNKRHLLATKSQSVSPSCGSHGSCSVNESPQQQHERPLSATESTGSSSRASSSTSGVHSESPAFSSTETDARHRRDDGQTTTCSSSMSASISSPDPSSSTPSICTSPVDMVDGGTDRKTVGNKQSADCGGVMSNDRSRSSRYSITERPKSMASLNDNELLEFRTGATALDHGNMHLPNSSANQYNNQEPRAHNPSQDYVNFISRQQQQSRNANYSGQRSHSMHSQTLNRYSSASSHHVPVDRMPKIPFQYTTSCYGGEAVLYYPSSAHVPRNQQQQRSAQQTDIQTPRACARIQSLDRHSQQQQPWSQQQNQNQLPKKSHVMMLRDYYLSLQEQSKQRQQTLITQHHHQQRSTVPSVPLNQSHNRPQPTNQQQSMLLHRLHHQQVPSPNELARLQYQQQHGNSCLSQNLLYRQQPASAAIAYQRIQPRMAKIRPNQFNGLYVKRAPSPSHLVANVARIATGNGATGGDEVDSSGLIVRPLGKSTGNGCGPASMMAVSQSSLSQQSSKMSSTSSTENSADDESDDCSTGEWMESTMV